MSSSNKAEAGALPPGWERHEDSEGAYYWHVKSGTIQRERPPHTGQGDDDMEAAAARYEGLDGPLESSLTDAI